MPQKVFCVALTMNRRHLFDYGQQHVRRSRCASASTTVHRTKCSPSLNDRREKREVARGAYLMMLSCCNPTAHARHTLAPGFFQARSGTRTSPRRGGTFLEARRTSRRDSPRLQWAERGESSPRELSKVTILSCLWSNIVQSNHTSHRYLGDKAVRHSVKVNFR